MEHATPSAADPATRTRGRRRLLALAGAVAASGMAAFAVPAARALTPREFWFMVHPLLGVLTVHAFAGGIRSLLLHAGRPARDVVGIISTATMAAVAWLTVLSGTWIVYPGRAEPPSQAADLSKYPEAVLTSDPQLAFWHTFDMDWKEHVGWITPFLATAVAFVLWRHGRIVVSDRRLRLAVTTLFVTAFAAAAVAAVLGGFINTVAPNAFLNAS